MEKKKRILIVDDEEDFLMLVKLNLEGTDKFEVHTLSSAKDIVSQVNDFKPDLILLDLLMPGVGGIDACAMLRKEFEGKGVPIVVILSALDKDIDKKTAYDAGVTDYLIKPIPADELIAKIEKILTSKAK